MRLYRIQIEYANASLTIRPTCDSLDEAIELVETIMDGYEVWGIDKQPPRSVTVIRASDHKILVRIRDGELGNKKFE